MLNLAEYRKKSIGLNDYLPWACLVGPGIVLNKDGSFQRTVRYRGPDLDSATEAELVAVSARLNNILKRFGAGWALIPAYLQAYRGSHIVITTIMFNFIAASLMVYIGSDILRPPGDMLPSSREFLPTAYLPHVHDIAALLGIPMPSTPLNVSPRFCAARSIR